jgi:putative ABC transport system substrate-binding protein
LLGIRRREFITLLGAAAWPLAASAQQPAMPVVGFLNGGSPDGYAPYVAAFHEGLKQTGYIDAQNVAIEHHWAEGRFERLPAFAADLIQRNVNVIAATSTPAALAAKAATTTIPIVFTSSGDPMQLGLVAALSRPGGNVTGVTQLNVEAAPKRLELAHELAPTAAMMAVLVNPTDPTTETLSNELTVAARTLGLKLHIVHARTEADIDDAFAAVAQLKAGALVIGADVFFTSRSKQLGSLTLRHAVPTIYQYREFVEAGGLISYGGSAIASYRQAGVYAGRILKGENPGNLPVQQVTTVELIINLKTATALGLTIPRTLLGRADAVIE